MNRLFLLFDTVRQESIQTLVKSFYIKYCMNYMKHFGVQSATKQMQTEATMSTKNAT